MRTYRDVLEDYLAHVEAKSTAPDGGPCRPGTDGLLKRRPVNMLTIAHIGKESNRLEDVQVGLVEDLGGVQDEYDDFHTRVFVPLVVSVLRELGVRETARRSGHSIGAVSEALAGRSEPRQAALERYLEVASEHARASLEGAGIEAPRDQVSCLRLYLDRSS